MSAHKPNTEVFYYVWYTAVPEPGKFATQLKLTVQGLSATLKSVFFCSSWGTFSTAELIWYLKQHFVPRFGVVVKTTDHMQRYYSAIKILTWNFTTSSCPSNAWLSQKIKISNLVKVPCVKLSPRNTRVGSVTKSAVETRRSLLLVSIFCVPPEHYRDTIVFARFALCFVSQWIEGFYRVCTENSLAIEKYQHLIFTTARRKDGNVCRFIHILYDQAVTSAWF